MCYNVALQLNGPAVLVTPRTRHNLIGGYAVPTIASSRFYVYVLARPDGRPFYVGKGCGVRLDEHEREARRGHKCHKCSIIRKIWKSGGEVQRYIMLETDVEQDALDYEVELIALYGLSTLANKTSGGDGMTDYSPSPDARVRIGASSKARWDDPEARAKQVAAIHAITTDPNYRAKQSEIAKARWSDPEVRARQIAAQKAAASTPEARAMKSAAAKARHANPVSREANRARNLTRYADPQERARTSASSKAVWADPEKRAKMLAARRAAYLRRKAANEVSDE